MDLRNRVENVDGSTRENVGTTLSPIMTVRSMVVSHHSIYEKARLANFCMCCALLRDLIRLGWELF